jgi:hypothetical protein
LRLLFPQNGLSLAWTSVGIQISAGLQPIAFDARSESTAALKLPYQGRLGASPHLKTESTADREACEYKRPLNLDAKVQGYPSPASAALQTPLSN